MEILSIPYALATGGWLSLLLLFITAIATFYTALLLQRCMDVDPNIRTYPDVGERAFGWRGRIMVSIFMNSELYLVATGYLVLEQDNLEDSFWYFWAHNWWKTKLRNNFWACHFAWGLVKQFEWIFGKEYDNFRK